MDNIEKLNPRDFGFDTDELGYQADDGSYQDFLYIHSPTITFGAMTGRLSDDHIEEIMETWDQNMRILYAHNGRKGITHVVDYTELPAPTLRIKRVSKKYFDKWYNEGLLIHQAIIGLPAPYRAIAKVFKALNPNIHRSLHLTWDDAFAFIKNKQDDFQERLHEKPITDKALGTLIPFQPGCFTSITGQGTVRIYHVRDNLFYTSAEGDLEYEDIEAYIKAQSEIPSQFNFDTLKLINNSPDLRNISLKSRKALSNFVKSDDYPFEKVYLIATGIPKVAVSVFRTISSKLRERVSLADDVAHALQLIDSNAESDAVAQVHLPGKSAEEQLDAAKKMIVQMKETRARNIDVLIQVIGVLGWEDVSEDIEMPSDLENNPYQELYHTLNLIQKDVQELQEERRQYLEEVLHQKQLAEDAVRSKSDFLSTMSHEIRTPMNAILGLTEILMEEAPTPMQYQYLETLQFSGRNLLSLINDILDFNKLESSKVILEQIPFPLGQMLNHLEQSLKPLAKDKGIELAFKIPSNIANLQVESDPTRLTQILTNLLSNGIKFTDRGKVTLSIKALEEAKDGLELQFVITDTGIGIPESDIPKIWENFSQVSTSDSRKYGGSGLGLAITKRLVAAFDASIDVQSILGKGTKFKIKIDFSKAAMSVRQTKVFHEEVGTELKGLNILVVDDNKINLKVAERHLQSMGLLTKIALSGEDAIEIVNQHRFDLILMDLQMPGKDGFETTQEIHKIHPSAKVIALTADVFPEIKEKVIKSKMLAYLTKPIKKVDLYNELVHVFKNL